MTDDQLPPDLRDSVDEAVARARAEWLGQLQLLAAQCQRTAESVRVEDESCADSMLYVSTRLGRIVDRLRRG